MDPEASQLLSYPPEPLREVGLGAQFIKKSPPGVGCGAQKVADPSCVIPVLCRFPSLLLKLQTEVCKLLERNCFLPLETAPGLPGLVPLVVQEPRKATGKPAVGGERCQIY